MKRRHLLICACVTLAWLQAGCSIGPTRSDADVAPQTFEVGHRPHMAFPGATRAEVKALAMGAAQSRAWTITESTDDRLVVQRPLDPGSPVAREIAASGAAPGSAIEVTSYFLDERGAVTVALDAALVSAPPGATPTRTDYTETFRPSLEESLQSLHDNWSRNRARVASAAPPIGASSARADQDQAGDGELASSADQRHPAAWTNEAAAAIIAPTQVAPTQVAAIQPAPPPAATQPAPVPAARTSVPSPVSTSPTQLAAVPVSRVTVQTPVPQPRVVPGRAPAPVVDASSAITSGGTRVATTQPMTLPAPVAAPVVPVAAPVTTAAVAAAPVPSSANLMALYPSTEVVNWSYYAEQYARLRGCNVTSQGAVLIESRTDGEVHRVPCDGADSVLVQCQNGQCRGLL